jgi:hypothetical protein
MFRNRGLREKLRRRVIVHTDKHSIQGVLAEEYIDSFVLRRPEFLNGAQPQDLGGEVLVLREKVEWIQVLG